MRDHINDEETAANRSREQNAEKFGDDDSSDEDPALEREHEIGWKKEQVKAYLQWCPMYDDEEGDGADGTLLVIFSVVVKGDVAMALLLSLSLLGFCVET